MKNTICALLAACVAASVCSVAVVAEEPGQPAAAATAPTAAPPAASSPTAAEPGGPSIAPARPKVLPDGSLQLPDGRVLKRPVTVSIPAPTCYFIRTLRPVMPEDGEQRSGFIPLQARMLGTVREPDCSNGAMPRAVPVRRFLLAIPE